MRRRLKTEYQGSIPACAGEPGSTAAIWTRGTVYPRVCGGTTPAPRGRPYCRGLSPRVRGNHGDRARPDTAGGSIPACAGEPAARWAERYRERVYPRVCGGTPPGRRRLSPVSGLSPRVRGNPGEPGGRHLPAKVYPRVCGGTGVFLPAAGTAQGLSPRVRGNLPTASASAGLRRSIPACAGEPHRHIVTRPASSVYPRVCGGTRVIRPSVLLLLGLSPRVRGNPASPG